MLEKPLGHNPDICSCICYFYEVLHQSLYYHEAQDICNFCHFSTIRNFYLNRIVLLWNAMPPVDFSQSFLAISQQVLSFFRDHFKTAFKADIPCTFHISCPCASYSSGQECQQCHKRDPKGMITWRKKITKDLPLEPIPVLLKWDHLYDLKLADPELPHPPIERFHMTSQ